MKLLTVMNQEKEVVCLHFDHWTKTGEIVEVPITVPAFPAILELTDGNVKPVIGLPEEQRFRIEARAAGYKVLSNTPD